MRCWPRSCLGPWRCRSGDGAGRPASVGGRPGDEVRRSAASSPPSEGTHAAIPSASRGPRYSSGWRPPCGIGLWSTTSACRSGRRWRRLSPGIGPRTAGQYRRPPAGARSEEWAVRPPLAWHRSESRKDDTQLPTGRRIGYVFHPERSDTSANSRHLAVTRAGEPPCPVRMAPGPSGAVGDLARRFRGQTAGSRGVGTEAAARRPPPCPKP